MEENQVEIDIAKYNIEQNFKILDECEKLLKVIKDADELLEEEEE